MKKSLFILMAAVVMLFGGCSSLKVNNKTFSIDIDSVKTIVFQKKTVTDEEVKCYEKEITEKGEITALCTKIQNLSLKRADSSVPHPITDTPYVIVIKGEAEHHLILTEDMAFYDQVAYEYTDKKTFEAFKDLYETLKYEEKETEMDLF